MKSLVPALGKILVSAFAPIFGGLVTIWVLWNIETRFFPVVSDFRVGQVTRIAPGEYLAVGTLSKKRSCELLNLSVYRQYEGKPMILVGQFKKEIFGADAGTGEQSWGPVLLKFPPDVNRLEEIRVVALHRCHAFWLQQTTYGTFLFGQLSEPTPH